MIKLVFPLHRLPHLSREEFQRYWLETHGPLVRSYADVLQIRRYVQVHSLPDEVIAGIGASRGAPEPYDGVAELWFDSLESMGANTSEEARAAGQALLEDERKFIDHSRSPIWFAQEHEIIGPSGA